MSYTNWISLGTTVLGDLTISFSKGEVYQKSVDFQIKAYSGKLSEIDIAFDYRLDDSEDWKEDASIAASQSYYVENNKLIGIRASQYGTSNLIKWNFGDNYILNGKNVQVRLRILPRLISFGSSSQFHLISQSYGKNKSDFEFGSSTYKCIAKDNSGRFVCSNSSGIQVFENLEDSSPLFSIGGLNNPQFAKQIDDDSYIIADYGNNEVIECNNTLASVSQTYSIAYPIHLDFNEDNETLLITSESGFVREITWSDFDNGTTLWQSTPEVEDPKSATYAIGNFNKIVISDINKGVIIFDRNNNSYKKIPQYRLSGDSITNKWIDIKNPFRSYMLEDGKIMVVEKEGIAIDFEYMNSSSSSSIDSSSSSSSST